MPKYKQGHPEYWFAYDEDEESRKEYARTQLCIVLDEEGMTSILEGQGLINAIPTPIPEAIVTVVARSYDPEVRPHRAALPYIKEFVQIPVSVPVI